MSCRDWPRKRRTFVRLSGGGGCWRGRTADLRLV